MADSCYFYTYHAVVKEGETIQVAFLWPSNVNISGTLLDEVKIVKNQTQKM